MSEPLNLYELLMGEVGEVPVPRSFEETTAAAFRAQDLTDAQTRKRSQQLAAERETHPVDAADVAAFMGRGRSHAEVLSDFAAFSDRADKWQSYQDERAAKREAREREEGQQARVAELEAEAAEASAWAERQGRALRAANEGWAADRRRSEGASFRDDRQYVHDDRPYVRYGGEILGIS